MKRLPNVRNLPTYNYDFGTSAGRAQMLADDPYQHIQYDAQGRPYIDMPGQPRVYLNPNTMGIYGSEPNGGQASLFRAAPRWNAQTGQWERGLNWTNLMNLGVGAGLTAGLGSAIFGGNAGSAAVTNTAAGSGPGAGITATTAAGGASIPAAATTAGVSAAVQQALGGGGGGNALSKILGSLGSKTADALLSPRGILTLASLIPLLRGGAGGIGGNAGPVPTPPKQTPAFDNAQVQAMLALAQRQAERVDPLHEAAVNTAYAMMPIASRTRR